MVRKFFRLLFMGAGILLIAYPWISNWLYEKQSGSQVKVYEEQAGDKNSPAMQEMLKQARDYNDFLSKNSVRLVDPFAEKEGQVTDDAYSRLLDLGDGLMGYVKIPVIGVTLPVFHGTGADVLEHGAGHLEGSSLPVGGEGTHTVLTGHTGLSHAKLFTDLGEMKKGDLFFIRCAGQELCYRVSSIQTVLPNEIDSLLPQEGKDLATLVTCTPYGVNSHRLLVTGERTEYVQDEKQQERRSIKSPWMHEYRNAALLGMLLTILLEAVYRWRKKRKGAA